MSSEGLEDPKGYEWPWNMVWVSDGLCGGAQLLNELQACLPLPRHFTFNNWKTRQLLQSVPLLVAPAGEEVQPAMARGLDMVVA